MTDKKRAILAHRGEFDGARAYEDVASPFDAERLLLLPLCAEKLAPERIVPQLRLSASGGRLCAMIVPVLEEKLVPGDAVSGSENGASGVKGRGLAIGGYVVSAGFLVASIICAWRAASRYAEVRSLDLRVEMTPQVRRYRDRIGPDVNNPAQRAGHCTWLPRGELLAEMHGVLLATSEETCRAGDTLSLAWSGCLSGVGPDRPCTLTGSIPLSVAGTT